MKIAIEAQRIFRTKKHGMDFVALEVIRHLQKIDRENQYYILVAPGEDRCLEESPNFKIVEVKCPTYPLWEQVALPLAVRRIDPDILHCTSNTAPIFCSVPLVLTLHDIIFLEKRHGASRSLYQTMGWYYRRLVVPRVLPRARQIITVSNFERERIREALKLDDDKIVAIYNGYSEHFRPVVDSYTVTWRYIKEPSYIFFLGNTDPKKNTARTLQAYALYLERSKQSLPLLVADIKADSVLAILRENRMEHLEEHLRFSGYIRNEDLPSIYTGARVFLYTSLRESFGIPILEAMASGTPVITSDTSSMPEVAGHGAILVDPTDVEQIADKLIEMERDEDLRKKQIEYGLKRVENFSWEHTATQLLKVYNQISKKER